MTRFRMLAAVVICGLSTLAASAPVTVNMVGTIGRTCSPPADTTLNPACTQNAFNTNDPGNLLFANTAGTMAVSGSVTYDSVTFAVSAMTLNQVGSFVGDTGNTFSTQDVVTYSGMQWTYNATQGGSGGPALRQTAATVSCSDNNSQDAGNPGCPNPGSQYLSSWVQNNGSDLNNSLFDFTGVPAGYAINSNLLPIAQQNGVQNVINNGSTLSASLVATTGNSFYLYHTVSRATLNLALDTDGDGIPDSVDNCKLVSNPSQCDSDGDGYGNRCDGDLNNNNVTNSQDYVLFRAQLGQPSTPPAYNKADINCNGAVNSQDYVLFRGLLGSPPGPSGLHP